MIDVDVRPGTADDLGSLNSIYNHYVVHTPATFDIEPSTLADRAEWLSHYGPDGPHRLLVAVIGSEVVGYATSSTFRPKAAYNTTVATSVYCHPNHVGQGIGTRLYEALFAELKGEDLHRATAGITLPNEASLALHRRFGFTEIGVEHEVGRKFGRYWDVMMLEKPLPA